MWMFVYFSKILCLYNILLDKIFMIDTYFSYNISFIRKQKKNYIYYLKKDIPLNIFEHIQQNIFLRRDLFLINKKKYKSV